MGAAPMTEHLGGPEAPEELRGRRSASGQVRGATSKSTEVGSMVVLGFQGRGSAVTVTAQAIELARRDKHRFIHAFPNLDNAPSNVICRKLGFELLETCEFEYPKGTS
jgi:RimJ/RimL family protein N-acetyltransferase